MQSPFHLSRSCGEMARLPKLTSATNQTMASFVFAPLTAISIRGNTQSPKCTLTKKVFPFASSRPGPTMQTPNFSPNDEMDDDDDVTMGTGGGPGPGYGMRTPPLTPSDKIYLDGAKDNKEYMARMIEIARRVRQEQTIIEARQPKQTPDQYVENLARRRDPVPEGEIGEPKLDPTEEYMRTLSRAKRNENTTRESAAPKNDSPTASQNTPVTDPSLAVKPTDSMAKVEDKIRAIQKEIEQVSGTLNQSEKDKDVSADVMEKLNEMARAREIEDLNEAAEDMTLEEGVRRIEELQRQIREAAIPTDPLEPKAEKIDDTAVSEVEVEAEQKFETPEDSGARIRAEPLRQSHVGKDPDTVDKQIDYLESYLSKLQQEEAKDLEVGEKNSVSQEPTRDLGEEARIAMSTLAEQVGKMPKDRTPFQGLEDTPGEMSAEDKMAIFEELRRRSAAAKPSSEFADPLNVTLPKRSDAGDDDYHDEPSPESEAEYDSFNTSFGDKSLLIEEIETEMKAYSRDMKALLQKHETRVQILLERLRAL